MIPASTTHSLLKTLHSDLHALAGKLKCAPFPNNTQLEKRFQDFYNLLQHAEDDLSIIVSLIEKDPDCHHLDAKRRLQALIDYVDIACAIYESEQTTYNYTTLH